MHTHTHTLVHLVGALEYTVYISAEGQDSPTDCPRYDTKQSDGEAPVMLELWGMRSTPLLPWLFGPLLPGVVAPYRVLFMSYLTKLCS